MIKYISISVIALVYLSSCNINSKRLLEDSAVKAIFSSEEIASLNLIVAYFDEIIIAKTGTQNVGEAYSYYFKVLSNVMNGEELSLEYYNALARPEDADTLIEVLKNNGIFDEIWFYSSFGRYNTRTGQNIDSAGVSLQINQSGKYMQLLGRLGNEDIIFKGYYDGIMSSSDPSPSVNAGIFSSYDKVDFRKEAVRLVWAIHFITMHSSRDIESTNALTN